jgi:hypothetical protein
VDVRRGEGEDLSVTKSLSGGDLGEVHGGSTEAQRGAGVQVGPLVRW